MLRVARGVKIVFVSVGCNAKTPPEPPARSALPGVTTGAAPSAAASADGVPAAVSPVAEKAPPKPNPPKPCNVALVGDSLTDYRVHGGGYARYLAERCPASHFENFARGGAMVNQMRRSFEENVATAPRGTFTHVIVFGGVNDLYSDETAGRTTAKIEADLSAIYARARDGGARVVALTVAPWGGFTRWFTPHRAETTRELNAWILAQRAARTVDVTVDAHALLACGDADRLCPRFETARSDGLHFGAAGHEALGAALYAAEFEGCP
ncbi:MAG TPA: SGNH/GDSL hydrolase family protein [Polyangiaceae bacterium]|nr:SGNH/GDSL hydrolase family protein [Polyangiaceae bacterium]